MVSTAEPSVCFPRPTRRPFISWIFPLWTGLSPASLVTNTRWKSTSRRIKPRIASVWRRLKSSLRNSTRLADLWPALSLSQSKPKAVTITVHQSSSKSSNELRRRCDKCRPDYLLERIIRFDVYCLISRMAQLLLSTRFKLEVVPPVSTGATSTSTSRSLRISSPSARKCSLEDITVSLNSGRK